MKAEITRTLIETIVRKTINDIKDSPERGIRKLVDMALQFSEGRFQKEFFVIVQKMLEDEGNAYYALLRDLNSYMDTDRLVRIGMNFGYNGCTLGAKRIREISQSEGYHVPWYCFFDIDPEQYPDRKGIYESVVTDGEKLGIYVWQMNAGNQPELLFPLVEKHPDSAFSVFGSPRDFTDEVLDYAEKLDNLMLVVHYDGTETSVWSKLRERGILYATCSVYTPENLESVLNDDLFYDIQQCHPVFGVLLSASGCTQEERNQVYARVRELRESGTIPFFPYEMVYDNTLVDSIISGNASSIGFMKDGSIKVFYGNRVNSGCNLFDSSLEEIFRGLLGKDSSLLIKKQG